MQFCFFHNYSHILRLSCKMFAQFTVIKDDAILQGSVLGTFNNMDVPECQFECMKHPMCKSINTNEGKCSQCQLSANSTEDPRELNRVTSRFGWKYFSTDFSETKVR